MEIKKTYRIFIRKTSLFLESRFATREEAIETCKYLHRLFNLHGYQVFDVIEDLSDD